MKYPVFSLENKKIVLTGASRGIGRAAALTLAYFGADLLLVSRNISNNAALEEEIRTIGQKAFSCACDISNLADIERMAEVAYEKLGLVDVLINNAGVAQPQPALEVTEESWDRTLNTDLRGLFFCSQAIGRRMIECGTRGKVVNVASTFAVTGYPMRAAYGSAKGGVVQLTRVLAVEWAPYGITVNTVSPTAIRTDMIEKILKDPKKSEDLISKIPLGRIGEPEDICGAIAFLSSPASDFITGHNLMVDGGWSAQ